MKDHITDKVQRHNYIDLAKGVMILFVIAGHIIEGNFAKTVNEPLHAFIYAFHMPLFFLLSGYVAGLTRNRLLTQNFKTWLWHKVQRLLIPYFVWVLLVYPIIDPTPINHVSWTFDAIINILFVNPKEGGAWFLLSLFCIQIVCYPILKYEIVLTYLAPILVMAIGIIYGSSFYYTNTYFYVSYLIGYHFFRYSGKLLTPHIAEAALIVFILSTIIYPNPLFLTVSAATILLYMSMNVQRLGGGKLVI